MKQVKPNPWDLVAEKYPAGTIIEAPIKSITDFGFFIGIEEGIDGLIHVSDLSWTKKIHHPSEMHKVGDVVQAKVLLVDKENEKFTLGIKQLAEDPWLDVPNRYPVGKKITGVITNITDFGLFVEVEEGIEGLVHISEMGKRSKIPKKASTRTILSKLRLSMSAPKITNSVSPSSSSRRKLPRNRQLHPAVATSVT